MQAPVPSSADALLPSALAEAARYALLRRLAPSMRHHLVVNLQPIGMIYEVMDRRLRAAQPDLAHVQESASKINGFARAALNASLDVVGWLAPDDAVPIAVQEGARECVSLLATSLSFRGYSLRNEVTAVPGQVRRSTLRTLLTGVLVYSTDHRPPPADLALQAQAEPQALVITVATRNGTGDKGFASEPGYRKIEWGDMQALAAAERVELAREGERITMRVPWMSV